MPDLTIRKGLWADFVEVAEKQHKNPEKLVQQVLSDYIQRVSDEELLDRSLAAGRRASFRIESTEKVLREYRHKKRG